MVDFLAVSHYPIGDSQKELYAISIHKYLLLSDGRIFFPT
jgi:hypothetical protein